MIAVFLVFGLLVISAVAAFAVSVYQVYTHRPKPAARIHESR